MVLEPCVASAVLTKGGSSFRFEPRRPASTRDGPRSDAGPRRPARERETAVFQRELGRGLGRYRRARPSRADEDESDEAPDDGDASEGEAVDTRGRLRHLEAGLHRGEAREARLNARAEAEATRAARGAPRRL